MIEKSRLESFIRYTNVLRERHALEKARLEDAQAKLEAWKEDKQLLEEVQILASALCGNVYGRAAQQLAGVLDFGIRFAYSDRVQSVVTADIKARRPTLTLEIQDDGVLLDPATAHGGGLASIIGLLARVVLILASGQSRILVLDEPFASVSKYHQELVSELLRRLVDDLDFQVLMITHQPRFASSADLVYEVTDKGKISMQQ